MKLALSGAMFGEDILQHIQVAGEIGYSGVELRGMGSLIDGLVEETVLEQIKDRIARWNLKVSCFSTWLGGFALRVSDSERERELERCQNFFRLSQELDCPFVRINPARVPPLEANKKQWEMDSEWIAKAADSAKEFGVCVVMELHHGTICDTAENAIKLLNMIDRKEVGLVYDPYNLYQVPTDYGTDTISKLGQKIFNVHSKDIVALQDDTYPYAFEFEAFIPHAGRFIPVIPQKTRKEHRFFANRLINQGALDWYHIISSLRSIGYTGYLTVEATSGKDPNMLNGKNLAQYCYQQLNIILESVFK